MVKRRMRFLTWAKKDPEDETPIDYTFTWADGTVSQFTSEDEVSYSFIEMVRNAWVDTIEKIDGRWKVKIYE